MLDIDIRFKNIEITNIQQEDLPFIEKWSEYDEQTGVEQLSERYLESCLSECEYFLKLLKDGRIIGVLKGRVEFKNPNEAWIWFFYLDPREGSDLDREIIGNLFEFLRREYDIKLFFTRVAVNDEAAIKFWKKVGFRHLRMVKDYYSINGINVDMIIMENGSIDNKLLNIL